VYSHVGNHSRVVGAILRELPPIEPSGTIEDPRGASDAVVVDHATHYRLTGMLGLNYGPSFQGLQRAEVLGQSLSATIKMPASVSETASQFLIHPVLLDVCFQSLVDFFHGDIDSHRAVPVLPVRFGRLRYYSDAPVVRCRALLKRRSERSLLADFELLDAINYRLNDLGRVIVESQDTVLVVDSVQRDVGRCFLGVGGAGEDGGYDDRL